MRSIATGLSRRQSGHTLTEVLIATTVSGLVLAGAYSVFSHSARQLRAGSYQTQFNALGRNAAQKITRLIEQGKAVGLSSNGLDIMTVNFESARLLYTPSTNGNPAESRIWYVPDITRSQRFEICRFVTSNTSPAGAEAMFALVPSSPNAAMFSFHVGDGTNMQDTAFGGTGEGYQGVEIRFSATPRNLQRWYD